MEFMVNGRAVVDRYMLTILVVLIQSSWFSYEADFSKFHNIPFTKVQTDCYRSILQTSKPS